LPNRARNRTLRTKSRNSHKGSIVLSASLRFRRQCDKHHGPRRADEVARRRGKTPAQPAPVEANSAALHRARCSDWLDTASCPGKIRWCN
jgi:hypothetical protein